MHIVAHRPHAWFLAEEDGTLFLDVHCSSGAAGYTVLARLTAVEVADYTAAGDASLDRLATAIQDHGPDSFAQRDVGPEINRRFHATVMAWNAAQSPS